MQQNPEIRFLPCGDTAFSMEFGMGVDRATNARVIGLYRRVLEDAVEGVTEMIPTFRALLVMFDPNQTDPQELQDRLLSMLQSDAAEESAGRIWRLPVSYGGDYGPDLDEVASRIGQSPDDVRDLHSSQDYFVYMIGFLPGFGYMGDLPESLRLPRRTSPRTHVPKGSVAIAKEMTAVYSMESPGGWHLLGRCPVPLFNPDWEKPVLLSPGDTVRFEAVSENDFASIERDVAAGTYSLKQENTI